MNNSTSVPKSADSKDTLSCAITTLPVEVPHSSVGELDQQTHTMRNRLYDNKFEDLKYFNTQKFLRSRRLQPQFGLTTIAEGSSVLSALRAFAALRGINLPRESVNVIEGLVALYLSLRECQSRTQFLSTVVLYLRGHTTESVMMSLSGYLESIIGLKSQSGSDDPQWLEEMRDLQHNWTRAINGEGFSLVSKVISLCLALGMCNVSQYQFTLGGIRMFSIDAYKKHCTAIDLADACFSTVCYFVEGGYQCFVQGSFKPLLFGGFNMENFEENHSKCYEWFELTRAGNLQRIADVTENDFEKLLSDTIEVARDLVRTSQSLVEKNILSRKMEGLNSLRANFRQTRVQGGIKIAPYCIGLFGGSGVGKSFLTQVLMSLTLKTNGHSADPERIVTINDSDKFMSNYRSYVNGVIIDDLGNTNANFVEKAPTAKVIEIVNNVRSYANMAEADMKGKVSIEPYVTIITKNMKDSCAGQFSNEPASITRRENVTITVNVREQYATNNMLDSEKVARAFPEGPPTVPDLWYFTVERSFPVPSAARNAPASVGWEVLHYKGKALEKISITELIRFVVDDSRIHFKNQATLVDNTNSLHDKLTVCECCQLPTVVCECVPEEDTLSQQFGIEDIVRSISPRAIADGIAANNQALQPGVGHYFWERIWNFVAYNESCEQRCAPLRFLEEIEHAATDKIVEDLRLLESNFWCHWMAFVPSYMITNNSCRYLLDVMTYVRFQEERRNYAFRTNQIFFIRVCVSIALFCSVHPVIGVIGIFYAILLFARDRAVRDVCAKAALYREINSRRDALPSALQHYRDNHSQIVIGSCAALAGLYLLAQGWKAFRCIPVSQGNLAPSSMADIEERDEEKNPWAQSMVAPMPVSEVSRTSVHSDIVAKVAKNLCYMSVERGGKRAFCNAFFPCSNVVLIPSHFWKSDSMKATFVRHEPEKLGGNFTAILSKATSIFIPETDICLSWVPSGGDWANLTQFLPLGNTVTCPASLVYKDKRANVLEMKMLMVPGMVRALHATFEGCNYTLSQATFDGLCMGVCVTDTKGPCIGGFHLAGVDGTPRGASGTLTIHQFETAFAQLRQVSCVLLSNSSGTIPKKQYGIEFYQSNALDKKSPVNSLPEGSDIRYYGQVLGRATYYSDVVPTPISDLVEKHCNVVNKWGKPSFHEGYPWQASLQYSANPSLGMPGDLLCKAKNDYLRGILEKLDSIPEIKKEVRPLTNMEVVCGRDGVRFIDKMPPNTSVGYPLGGPKRDHLVYLDSDDYPDFACPAQLNQEFWDEALKMEELYLRGERAYPIFKACLKDEPTLLTKTKVRVFQGAPVAFQLLVRKYYLPILRILSLFPLTSECAVGINAQGPEWEALCTHMSRFGKDRILAGDYGKYDLRKPAQIMLASLRVYCDIGRACGYSERDLTIMEGIATDIAYPLTAYNGDLIQLMGSTPSGVNMTVYLNSTDNSLFLRCFFYSLYPEDVDFRSACAAMTYGDDMKGSVHEDYSDFNHITFANFLKQHDIVFTMPDKESTPTEYMNDSDADFLKRKNVFVPEIGMHLGALDENSIFKSLHSVLKSKAVSTRQQAMSNIDGALREWFAHGREVYEQRRSQMQAIAAEADIAHGCLMLQETYDDRVLEYCEKYSIEAPELESH